MASSMARKSSSAMGPCSSSSFASPFASSILSPSPSSAVTHFICTPAQPQLQLPFQLQLQVPVYFLQRACYALPPGACRRLRLHLRLSFVYLPSLMNINTTLVSFGANHVRSTGHGCCCGTAALPYGAVSCMWQTLTHWALLKRDEDWFGQTIVCIHRIWHHNVNDWTHPTWYLSIVSLTEKGHFHKAGMKLYINR